MDARDRCAAAVMDVGLLISRLVKAETWRRRPAGLTTQQFRALAFVNAYPASSPSALADYLNLRRPTVSKLVDELVRRRLLERRADTADRRRIMLFLTAAGRRRLDAHFAIARALVAERLASLTASERATVTRAVALLRPRFTATSAPSDDRPPRAATGAGAKTRA